MEIVLVKVAMGNPYLEREAKIASQLPHPPPVCFTKDFYPEGSPTDRMRKAIETLNNGCCGD